MTSFTDQKLRVATEEECKAGWSGGRNGAYFRCYLCGHAFIPGDQWRWIYSGSAGVMNATVCGPCDGPDVLERWVAMNYEAWSRFWWLRREDPISKNSKIPKAFAALAAYRAGEGGKG